MCFEIRSLEVQWSISQSLYRHSLLTFSLILYAICLFSCPASACLRLGAPCPYFVATFPPSFLSSPSSSFVSSYPLPRTPTRCALFLLLVPLFFPLTGPYSFPSSSPLPRPMVGISLPQVPYPCFPLVFSHKFGYPPACCAPLPALGFSSPLFCRNSFFPSPFRRIPTFPFLPWGTLFGPPRPLWLPIGLLWGTFPHFRLVSPFSRGQISSFPFLPLLSLVLTFRPLGRRFPLSSDPALCHPASFTSPVAAPPPPAITPKSIPLIPSSTRSLSRL